MNKFDCSICNENGSDEGHIEEYTGSKWWHMGNMRFLVSEEEYDRLLKESADQDR